MNVPWPVYPFTKWWTFGLLTIYVLRIKLLWTFTFRSLCGHVCRSLRWILSGRTASPYRKYMLNLFSQLSTRFPMWRKCFHFNQQCTRFLVDLYSFPHLIFSVLVMLVVVQYLTLMFNLQFPAFSCAYLPQFLSLLLGSICSNLLSILKNGVVLLLNCRHSFRSVLPVCDLFFPLLKLSVFWKGKVSNFKKA